MEKGLRLLAFIIDAVACFALLPLIFTILGLIVESAGSFGLLFIPVFFVGVITWPFIYFGVPTGIWGRTPGKWICRIRVVQGEGEPVGFWQATGRESLKLLGCFFMLGGIAALLQVLSDYDAWYDTLCGTDARYVPWLTRAQRSFRNVFPTQRRGL